MANTDTTKLERRVDDEGLVFFVDWQHKHMTKKGIGKGARYPVYDKAGEFLFNGRRKDIHELGAKA